MKKRFTCESFLDFQFVSDPQISPDGKYTAFLVKKAKIETNSYESDLYLLDNQSGEQRQMTAISPVSAYAWKDENTIVFPAIRKEKGKEEGSGEEQKTYYELNIHRGEAREWVTLPIKGGKLHPIGKDLYAVLASYDNDRPDVTGLDAEQRKQVLDAYKKKQYTHIKEIPFVMNGEGYTSRKRNRLYLYHHQTGELTPVTDPMFHVMGIKARDGKILYVGQEFEHIKSLKNGIYLYDTITEKTECLLEKDRYIVKGFELYGEKAVLNLTDALSFGNGENGNFYTIDLKTKEWNMLSNHEHHCIGNTITSDIKMGTGQTLQVDGDYLYYTSTVDMDCIVERLHLKTGVQERLTETGSVDFLDIRDGMLICAAAIENRMPELYQVKQGEFYALTSLNQNIQEEYEISVPERIQVRGSSPWPIQGYVLRPVGYEPGKKYPGILHIHGGPRLTYGPYFFHQMQLFASAGYFVFFCNARGSEGRGNEFADIRKQFGGIDYIDFMEFTDAVLEQYPEIDPNRLGVEGGSYGGFMTNWIIGHTDRFAAACSGRSIANWTGMEGTTDIGYYFCKGQTGASHMEDHELQWKQSPLAYANRCVTPTLFLHGEKDYRCHMQESFQMFAALKLHHCPAKLCLFEGENHELSRSGRPKQRLQRLLEMFDWFQNYLGTQEERKG